MKNFKFLILAACCTTLLFSSCKSDDEEEDTVDCDTYEWSYVGDTDPETWHTCNADCGGNAQSPINITGSSADASLAVLETNYTDTDIDLFNNGHTVECTYDPGSNLTIGGVEYSLAQFHFHTLSEHTIDGNHYPMEIHLVHESAGGSLAVISILVAEGEENAFLKNFSDNYPATPADVYQTSDMINITDLLPSNTAYYTYSGSLTTPPCSEMVTWFVMKSPVEASSAQIGDMAAILNSNYRPTQGLNGRAIGEFN